LNHFQETERSTGMKIVMGTAQLLCAIAGLGLLSACHGSGRASIGFDPDGGPGRGAAGTSSSKANPAPAPPSATAASMTSAPNKLIALTFDDGPRPYVLLGAKGDHPAPALLDVLDQNGVKATFFVVGWRLTSKTWGERHEQNIGVSCLDAAEEVTKRGHEIEDHTYSHIELRSAERKKGEQWVLADVEKGAQAIKAVTGTQPRYIRPPDWALADDTRRDLERRGYHVLTISSQNPVALRDINSLDYLCAGRNRVGCPKPTLVDSVLKQVELREKKGINTHILAFHELTSTAAIMPELISELKARGYRFVTVTEYMTQVGSKPMSMK
jgi:peptidoglycan/xylan/chitin deacetylase (PgdA/CDA1 family)